jgi:dCMP deaminase
MLDDAYYFRIAKAVATKSKCISLQVGCILVKDDRIVATGVNGTPRGYVNCSSVFTDECTRHMHHEWSQKYEIHAEMNAIIQAGCFLQESVAYCTHSPCWNCCKHLIAAGVRYIKFLEVYHRFTSKDLTEIEQFCRENIVTYEHYVGGENG